MLLLVSLSGFDYLVFIYFLFLDLIPRMFSVGEATMAVRRRFRFSEHLTNPLPSSFVDFNAVSFSMF